MPEHVIGFTFKICPESTQFSLSPLPASWSKPPPSLHQSPVITSYQPPSFHFPLTGPHTSTCLEVYSQHTLLQIPKWPTMSPIPSRVKSQSPSSGHGSPEESHPLLMLTSPPSPLPFAHSSPVTLAFLLFSDTQDTCPCWGLCCSCSFTSSSRH